MKLIVATPLPAIPAIIQPEALKLKELALKNAGAIVEVWDEQSQMNAVNCMKEIKGLLKECESTRKELKKPAIDFGRKIEEIADNFSKELDSRYTELGKMVSAYQEIMRQAELKRKQEEWDKQRKIEAELEKKIANAKNDAQAEKAAADAQRKMELSKQAEKEAEVKKEKGMAVTKVPVYEIFDLAAAYEAHPELFKVEEKRSEILTAIKKGMSECAGMTITWETRTAVTA